MKPLFSEFSYGYAVTEDIVRSNNPLKAAPIFPSLRSEGTQGGFDVKLDLPGSPLFLQFKLSDCMVRNTAYESRQGLFASEFYRMPLRPRGRSQQHKLLLKLEATGKAVYYVAPAFYQDQEFNRAYTNRSILKQSVMISPAAIGPLPDDGNHHIAFERAQVPFGYLLSQDWRRVEILSWEDAISPMNQRRPPAEWPLPELLSEMEGQMLEIVSSHFEDALQMEPTKMSRSDEDLISRVASLSQIFFNCTFFIVQRST